MENRIDHELSDRQQWLDEHKHRLGSSDIAAIAGLNKYRTPLHVWSEKTGRIPTLATEEAEANDAIWLGTKLEPIVAEMFARKTGLNVWAPRQYYTRTDIPWAIATPDYFYTPNVEQGTPDAACLECKTTGAWNKEAWDGKIPDSAHLQVIYQMGIIGMKQGSVAGLIGGRDFVHQDVTFDAAIFDQLVTMGENFMRMVREDTPPPATPDDAKLLTTLNPISDEEIELADEDSLQLLANYRHAKLVYDAADIELDLAKRELDAIKSELRQKMGKATLARIAGYELSQKVRSRKEFVSKATSWVEFKVKEPKHD